MALTNYVTQSLMGIALFYGVGLGIGPRFGMIGVLVACASMVALQMWWSRAWLARFTHGPLEWVWRWFTQGSRPRFRIGEITVRNGPTLSNSHSARSEKHGNTSSSK
jgi:uncharacterized protein